MSAIWGIVDLDKKEIKKNFFQRMKVPYKDCIIDRFLEVDRGHAVMGCGIQYFTKEDELAVVPTYESKEHLLFTGDVYLDNREEILSKLNIKKQEWDQYADVRLILESYKRWGLESLKGFEGSYAFVIYNDEKNEIICATDPASSRCLYYYQNGSKFYFSTLISPILEAIEDKIPYNKRWLVDFLAMESLATTTECIETPYQGIYKVEPGQCIIINQYHSRKIQYFNPLKGIKKLKLNSDEEYKQAFQEVFIDSVKQCLRSKEKTGILLSGGLDSTSIACVAAKELKERNQMLYSYTSIPEEGYVSDNSPYYIVNEKESVEYTKGFTKNITSYYCDMKGKNAWEDIGELLKILEVPYKAFQNMQWIYTCMAKAREDGCRVMLSGQYGNVTISYGGFYTYLSYLLRRGKIITFWNELNALCRKYHTGRKRIIGDVLGNILPNCVVKIGQLNSQGLKGSYVSKEMLKKYKVKWRFWKENINFGRHISVNMNQIHQDMYMKTALSQIGEAETKLSLATGILMKDPSRSKRIISFVLSLPLKQFVQDGQDRRLIREYMKEDMPEEILKKTAVSKGLQSADFGWRLKGRKEEIIADIKRVIAEDMEMNFFDKDKVLELVSQYTDNSVKMEDYQIGKLLYVVELNKFVASRHI